MLGRKVILFGLASCLVSGVLAKPSAIHPSAKKPAVQSGKKSNLLNAATVAVPWAAVTSAKLASAAPASASPASRLPATVSDSGPEAQLVTIFKEIEANQLNNALQLTEALLRQHPNYRLANLIKGDLLLARRQDIQTFGAMSGAPAEKVADLRAEAIVRLRGYREKPETNNVPRYLLQMQPDQRHAIVVDTKRSRLYLYENDLTNGGRPRFVADYYVTQGKLGAEKLSEGDKKTPIGVYHVTSSVPRQKLADLYGSGAFPINYPNEWDKRQGRNGSGIWLHGTPSNTFARPPKASEGCVVLTNQDL
ncbi:MAG TPA: L,D-transpeptidase family protein, partial [Azonexus sp.]|nr:L,D-transpeptidase family protein [Azonexus sp.]